MARFSVRARVRQSVCDKFRHVHEQRTKTPESTSTTMHDALRAAAAYFVLVNRNRRVRICVACLNTRVLLLANGSSLATRQLVARYRPFVLLCLLLLSTLL